MRHWALMAAIVFGGGMIAVAWNADSFAYWPRVVMCVIGVTYGTMFFAHWRSGEPLE
jgi:hypothetical protein